jgi:hypothetical protein
MLFRHWTPLMVERPYELRTAVYHVRGMYDDFFLEVLVDAGVAVWTFHSWAPGVGVQDKRGAARPSTVSAITAWLLN